MHYIWDVFTNHALLCALAGWFVAQALKIPIKFLLERKWDFKRFFGSGGMPSSHSAMVVSLAIVVGALDGFHSTIFAACCVLACIVMYDAAGVRRETGTQAAVINRIIKDLLINGKPITEDELKELVGHTPLEVFGGVIVGVLVASVYLALLLS